MPFDDAQRNGALDKVVARKAYYQHGLITTAQLTDLGVTRAQTRTRLARGQWTKVKRGVLYVEGAQITWESQLLAQILAVGHGAMASHRCAAAVWKLDGFRRPQAHEMVVPRSRQVRGAEVIVHHSTDLHLVKAVKKNRIPVTPLERTLLDLGAVCGRTEVLLAVDDALRRNMTTWDKLLNILVRHARRGRGGVAILRSILDEHVTEGAATDRGFERLVIVLLVEAGLPKPTLQHKVHLDGMTYLIDLAYVDERIAIELNGQIHREREVWEKDHERYAALTNAGWRVLPFSWRQYERRRSYIIRQVRLALAASQPLVNL